MATRTEGLAEKEFDLILELAKSPVRTQRDLSTSIGLSLGMTNLLLKRLARKGLIKVQQLDWNRTQYLLTLKGALEKTRKSFHYGLYTIRIFRQIRENIAVALRREYAAGRRDFVIVAQDELLELIQDTVRESSISDARFAFLQGFADVPAGAPLVMTATQEPLPSPRNGQSYLALVDFDNIDFRIAQ
jgi:DNA-binding MarR family transcriptional regulator